MKESDTPGDLLIAIREEKNISQKDLCLGLCSQAELSRIEKWERVPNRLLLNALFQRLGKSIAHFATVLSPGELEYFSWQQDVYEALGNEDEDRMQILLQEEIAQDRSCMQNLQEQFYQYMCAYIEHDYGKMKEAIAITLPNIKRDISKIPCIGTGEMVLLLLYLEQKLLHEEQGEEELRQCLHYLEHNYAEEELANIYPKVVLLLCREGKIDTYERITLCKKAFELLREQLRIREMPALLEILVTDMQKIHAEDVHDYQNYFWNFHELYQSCNMDFDRKFSFTGSVWDEKYILGDLIKKCRNEKNLSREQASTDICDVMTLGRIENRERGTKVKVYKQLAKRLDLPYENIYSVKLITNNYKCLQVGDEIQRIIRQQGYNGLKEKLEWLKTHLDLSVEKNRQYVEMEENVIQYIMKEKDTAKYRRKAIENLRITIPKWQEDYTTHFYTGLEIQLVNQIAVSYLEQEQYERCLHVIERMWENVNEYDHTVPMRAKELLTVMTTWVRALYCMDECEKAMEICEMGIKNSIVSGYGDKLSFWISEKCRIWYKKTEHNSETEHLVAYSYKQAYYWSLLFGQGDSAEVCRSILQERNAQF